jgi:hypothetical protein
MSAREILEIEISPAHALDAFVDYLHRLGCSVESRGNGRLIAFVTFPETVDDEPAALREWCRSWSRAERMAVVVEEPALVS